MKPGLKEYTELMLGVLSLAFNLIGLYLPPPAFPFAASRLPLAPTGPRPRDAHQEELCVGDCSCEGRKYPPTTLHPAPLRGESS